MMEQDMRKKIIESADQIEIPESISPGEIQNKLDAQRQHRKKQKTKYRKIGGITAAAVVLMFVYASGVFISSNQGNDTLAMRIKDQDITSYDLSMNDSMEDAEEVGSIECEEDMLNTAGVKKQDAGDLYVIAKDYGEVYDLLNAEYMENMRYGAYEEDVALAEDLASGRGDSSGLSSISSTMKEEAAVETSIADAADGEKKYSGTNLQVAGVDESDIIKTDGSYIYTVMNDTVIITDVTKTKMEVSGKIEISLNSGSDCILEMYVDGDILNLIVEKQETELNKNSDRKLSGMGTDEDDDTTVDVIEDETSSSDSSRVLGAEAADYEMDVYLVESNTVTELQTYDISDRTKPVLKGTVSQEGNYKTSRKIGDIIYLFTDKMISRPDLIREQAVLEENAGGWIPLVNGRKIAADCIYIPDQGSDGLIISSTNVKKPDQIVDNTMILNNYVNVYVSTKALYLYGQEYSDEKVMTQIAKFSLQNGNINAVGAASAAGEIYDTFAINEYQGKLRILTTDWSGEENENRLYLFDSNMELTGKLEKIAIGEEIYAARFFGDTAYFVTYRNTDPLFAVDLSDETNPKILSELEITGFSEYLHFWGEDKLVGIGYETDPDSGERKGIKLTMFDISNPADLKILGTCVIENADYSPALYNYKCVLVDETENMIGFATESYEQKMLENYLLFSWKDGKFHEIMSESLDTYSNLEEYRGMYIGDTFYLAEPESILSYDRKDGYRMMQKLSF